MDELGSDRLRVLLVEDNPSDARLIELYLNEAGGADFELTWIERLSEALDALQRSHFDLILTDLSLPDSQGLQTFKAMQSVAPDLPIVVLTGSEVDLQQGLKAVQEGAQDYLTKSEVEAPLLLRSLRYAMERKRTAKKLASMLEEVRRSRSDLLAIIDQLHMVTAMTDGDGLVTFLSRSGQSLLGIELERARSMHWQKLLPVSESARAQLDKMCQAPQGERQKVPAAMDLPNGVTVHTEIDIHDDPREPERRIFFVYDVTEVYRLRRQLQSSASFHDLVGKSEVMRRVFEQIEQIAKVDWTVLVEGETGTGKELAARAIHQVSERRTRPFVAINCGGLTESLLTSQLFGHRRGAFTGAVADQQGVFEAASGGTLFLDEIGDISHNVQVNLLRALERKEIIRLGETTPRQVDVRIVVATHRDLSEAVASGDFRQDLFYRIRVARITLPPLRQRKADIPLLVDSFIARSRADTGREIHHISPEAMKALQIHRWPGNVRELKNAIEYAFVGCRGPVILESDLPPEVIVSNASMGVEVNGQTMRGRASSLEPTSSAVSDQNGERREILDALERAGGNRSLAAKLLGVSRATFYRRLEQHAINAKKDSTG